MENEIKGLKIRKWIEYFEETLENETGVKFDNEPIKHPNGVLTALTMTTLFCICLFFKVNKI